MDSPGEVLGQDRQYQTYVAVLVAMTPIHSILQYTLVPAIDKIWIGARSFIYVDELQV